MLCGRVFAVLLDDISVTLVEIVVGDFTDMGAALRIISTSAELFIFWINAGLCTSAGAAGLCTSAGASAGAGEGMSAGASECTSAGAGEGDGAGDGDGASTGSSTGASTGAIAGAESGSGMLNTKSGISNTSFGISVTKRLTSPVLVFKVTISALTIDICILLSFYYFIHYSLFIPVKVQVVRQV